MIAVRDAAWRRAARVTSKSYDARQEENTQKTPTEDARLVPDYRVSITACSFLYEQIVRNSQKIAGYHLNFFAFSVDRCIDQTK